ncbi:hypothetical protein DFH06DRAFT_1319431 [Mycena polygramma]|nr:hypothetical protein DFH06DRAFT_1319431 [Mycena polygramma]
MSVANSTVTIGGDPTQVAPATTPARRFATDSSTSSLLIVRLTFTHLRASVDMPGWFVMGFRFPPYTSNRMEVLHARMDVKVPARPKGPPPPGADAPSGSRKRLFLAVAVALAGGLANHVGKLERLKAILISIMCTAKT